MSDPHDVALVSSVGYGVAIAGKVLKIERGSRVLVLAEFRRSLVQALELRARNAESDYSPDPLADRFPTWDPPRGAAAIDTAKALGLLEAVEGWWEEQRAVGLAESTYVNYRGAFRKLAAFLGHDEARRVSPEDVIRFFTLVAEEVRENVSARSRSTSPTYGIFITSPIATGIGRPYPDATAATTPTVTCSRALERNPVATTLARRISTIAATTP